MYDEQTAIDTADFQYQSRQAEETYVDKLSNALLLHPAHLVLYARLCCVEPVFDFPQFSLLLQYFTCSNMRVHFTAPLSQHPDPSLPWLTAPWHATPYPPPPFYLVRIPSDILSGTEPSTACRHSSTASRLAWEARRRLQRSCRLL